MGPIRPWAPLLEPYRKQHGVPEQAEDTQVGRHLPEHRNFLLLICPMRLLARRRGLAQRAPLVSMGLVRRKSASHLRLQSQMKGFWARCLSKWGRSGSAQELQTCTHLHLNGALLLAHGLQPGAGPGENAPPGGTSWVHPASSEKSCHSTTVIGTFSCPCHTPPFKLHSAPSSSTHPSPPLPWDISQT